MNRSVWSVAVVILVVVGACGARTPASVCKGNLLAGDLVLTEIMVNPSGDDTGKEWFEVYNNTGKALDATGLTLMASLEDGSSAKTHAVAATMIEPGAYFVFGGVANDLRPAYVGYGYGNDLGALRNDAGKIALRCNDVVVDEAIYRGPSDGASRGFTGAVPPDAVANDDTTKWCDATIPYDGVNLGSPGAANERCGSPPGASTCEDNGQTRDIVFPQVGDVVISEIMPNPSKVADSDGEWFEVTVLNDVDVNGLEIGTTPGTPRTVIVDSQCRRRAAGSRLVFAKSSDSAMNGGLPPVETTFSFDLSNSGGTLYVGVQGNLLDQISWTKSSDGASTSLDPGHIDPALNDDESVWCGSTTPYGDGDHGTPGEENDECPVMVPAGKCIDGDAVRDVVAPAGGDLVISEVLPNPNGADDGKEWFEVYVKRDVDLNGLQLGTTFPTVLKTFTSPNCLKVTAGSYLIFSHNDGSMPDGGLPHVDFRFAFDLVNSNRGVFLGFGDQLVDAVTYGAVTEGVARSLDPDLFDAGANDAVDAFCDAANLYGDGTNRGTPGAENDPCPIVVPAGKCLDGQTIRDVVRPAVGDLVITEVMPDPNAVADLTGEWFEVLVTRDVDVNDLELGTVTGTPQVTLADVNCRPRSAGSRLLFAKSSDPTANGQLPSVEATFGFGLTNSDSSLYIGVAGTPLDTVTWTTTTAGKAHSLDPGHTDPTQNDDPANWCDATIAYGAGVPPDLGTPAAANSPCPIVIPAGMCLDGQTVRPIVPPALGDVVISEIMPDPNAVGDATGEWFEVTVTKDVDLNGLEIGTTPGTPLKTVTDTNCRRRAAGARVVFGKTGDNGGLPPLEDTFTFSLANGGGTLYVGVDGTPLDAVTWTAATPGASRSLDPGHIDPTQNDTLTLWCDSTTTYGPGMPPDRGTPGAPNDPCPVVVPPGQCLDGNVLRAVVSPVAGDLVISEVMPNPFKVTDAAGEWFEVVVTRDVDLNGVEIGTAPGTPQLTLGGNACRRRTAGTRVVFGHSDTGNGGLPPLEATFGFSLTDDGTLFVGYGGGVLDQVSWAAATEGASRSLDPGAADPTANDDLASWCDSDSIYGLGDKGTPGAANDVCLPAGKCVDGGVARDIVAPAVGDLVITEFLANPMDADDGKEWFEVLVARDVDLNGLQIGTTPIPYTVAQTYNSRACLRVTASSRLIFSHNDATTPLPNGGLPYVSFLFNFDLPNSNTVASMKGIFLGLAGSILDSILYTSTTSGASRTLKLSKTNTVDNDLTTNFCTATMPYGDMTNKGTPGAADPNCP